MVLLELHSVEHFPRIASGGLAFCSLSLYRNREGTIVI